MNKIAGELICIRKMIAVQTALLVQLATREAIGSEVKAGVLEAIEKIEAIGDANWQAPTAPGASAAPAEAPERSEEPRRERAES